MYKYLTAVIITAVLSAGCKEKEKTPDNNDPAVIFSFSVTRDPGTKWHIVQLNAEHRSNSDRNISIKVCPEGGDNMFSFRAGEHELLNVPDDIGSLIKRFSGNPILYPTPNRIRNGIYAFMGDSLKMSFPEETRSHSGHGLVWDDTAWDFSIPEIRQNSVFFSSWYVFNESNPRFKAYPFLNKLTVDYTLTEDRVHISYTVENQDERPLGFGFALHPFWKVIGSKEETFIQVALPYHMEATKDRLPTGKIEPVEETAWSLLEPRPLSELRLDDVYFGAAPDSMVSVTYRSIGLQIQQKASADFTHVVVYTPDRDFFCIENQTCSTDAHNLYNKGYIEESHLQIVEPGKKTGGYVEYIIVRDD